MSKQAAVSAALAAISVAFQKTADLYGRLDSQDADFRNLKQMADAALAMPDDPDPTAPPPAPPDLSEPVTALAVQMADIKSALADGLAGIEDHMGAILAALPAKA